MNEFKETVGFIMKAHNYLNVADRVFEMGDDLSICNAAFNLAMCGEFTLKAALMYKGVVPTTSYNHKLLVKVCGESGLSVPVGFRKKCDILYEYEKECRYGIDYFVDKAEYADLRKECGSYLVKASESIIADAAKTLRSLLPPSVCGGTDEEIVREWWRNLPD